MSVLMLPSLTRLCGGGIMVTRAMMVKYSSVEGGQPSKGLEKKGHL